MPAIGFASVLKVLPPSPAVSALRLEEMRSSQRIFVFSGAVLWTEGEEHKHTSLIRDISEDGIFFYSDLRPQEDQELCLSIHVNGGSRPLLQVRGRVVRVQESPMGAAIGVAMAVSEWTIRPANVV